MTPLIRRAPVVLLFAAPVMGQELNDKAARYYESLQKRPAAGAVFDRFVDAWLDTDTLEHLETWLTAKVTAKPSVPGHILLGLFHVRQGAHAKAAEQYRMALVLEPANAMLWQQKAIAESRMLEFDLAIASLEKGLEQRPPADISLAMRQLLGRLLSRAGRASEALRVWEKLMEERPGDEALREDVLDLQLAEGLFEAAVKNAAALVERAPDAYKKAMRRLQSADVLDRAGRTDDALAQWEVCLTDSAAESWLEKEVLSRLDRVFRRDDNLTGLRAHLEGLGQKLPRRLGLARARVRLLAELGEKSAAVEAGQAMLALAPGDRAARDEFIALLVEAGRLGEAAAQVNELIRQTPGDRELLLKLAGLKLQAGDKAGSLAAVLEYDRLSGADEAARLRSAALLDRSGLTTEAIARLEAAAREFPGSAAVSQALASALHKAKRVPEALTEWRRQAASAGGTALQDIARAMSAHGEDEAAWNLLATKAADSTEVPLLMQLCQLAERLDRADEALPHARRLVGLARSAPDMEAALENAGRLIKRAGQADTIIASIAPEAGAADLCLLAELLEQRGDNAGAEAALDRVAKASPELAAARLVRLYRGRQAWPQAMAAGAKMFEAPGGKKAASAQMLAELAERARNTEDALKWTREWRKLSPGAAPAVLAEARLLRSMGKDEEALKVLRLAAGQFEENRDIREALARACRDAGRISDALSIYAALYEQAPDAVQKLRVVREWAEAALEADRMPEMIEQFEERRRQNRAGTGPLLALAEIYTVNGEREKQQRALTEASRLRPDDADLALMLASLQEEDDLVPLAIDTLKAALPHDKSGRVRQRLARLHLTAGDQQEGMKLLEETGDGSPPDTAAVESMALSMAESDPARALALLRARLEAEPEDYRLRYLLAVLLKENRDDMAALGEFSRLLTVKQENPAVTARRASTLLSADLERKLQQMTGVVPEEVLTALRTHETAVATGQSQMQAQQYMGSTRARRRAQTTTSSHQLPGTLAELQALTVVSLSSTFGESEEETRAAVRQALEREGRWQLTELINALPPEGLLSSMYRRQRESTDEVFPALKNDTARGLNVLLMLENPALRANAEVCAEVWRRWRETHPDFALAAALTGAGAEAGSEDLSDWEEEAFALVEEQEHPGPLVLGGIQRFLSGSGAIRLDGERSTAFMNRAMGWLEAPWMNVPAMSGERGKLLENLSRAAHAAEKREVLAAILSAEWPREVTTKQGGQMSGSPFSSYGSNIMPYYGGRSYGGSRLEPYTWPPRVLPGVSPAFGKAEALVRLDRDEAGEVAPLVTIPVLRAWLEDYSTGSVHPLRAVTTLARDPQADAATLTLAAVSEAEAENFEEAGALAVRALERPLPGEVRDLLEASLLAWAGEGMAAQDSPLMEAARAAALRLRRTVQSQEDKVMLARNMELLNMPKEAAALNPGGGAAQAAYLYSRVYGFREREEGPGALRDLLLEVDPKSDPPASSSLVRKMRRQAKYMLSPAGWNEVKESAVQKRYRGDESPVPATPEKLAEALKAKGGVEVVMKALDPGPEATPQMVAVFAVMNEVAGNPAAVALYRKALAAGALEPGARVRLIRLLWQNEPGAVAEQFALTSPEGQARLMEFFLPEGRKEPLERVLRVASMASGFLEKEGAAATVQSDWLNTLADLLSRELPLGPGLTAPRLDSEKPGEPLVRSGATPSPEALTKARELLTARRAAHEALCRGMLKVPGSSAFAFASLRSTLPAENPLAAEAVTASVAASLSTVTVQAVDPQQATRRARALLLGRGEERVSDAVELPHPEVPLTAALEVAVKTGDPGLLRNELVPALQKAGSARLAERVSLLADLYFNPAEEAEGIARRLIATCGEEAWSPVVKALGSRGLSPDLSTLLVAEVSRARVKPESLNILTGAVVDFCEWQCASGKVETARTVLGRLVEVLAGNGKQRAAAIKAGARSTGPNSLINLLNSGSSSLSAAPPPSSSLMEMLRRMISSRHAAVVALDTLYSEIVPVLPAEEISYVVNVLDLEHAEYRKPGFYADAGRVSAFFNNSPLLENVEKFRSQGGASGVFIQVVTMLNSLSANERKPVMEFLAGRPATFGRDVLMEAAGDRWGATPLNVAAQEQEKIRAQAPEKRAEMVDLLSSLASGRDRGGLTEAGVVMMDWVRQEESLQLNSDRTQEIENYLSARSNAAQAFSRGTGVGQTGAEVLDTAIKGMSPRAYDVVRRTASLARVETAEQMTALLTNGEFQGKAIFPLPPDRAAFRMGILTNTLCAADRRVPVYSEELRATFPRTAGWIASGLTGDNAGRLTGLVKALTPFVKEGEGCVMLEAFPLPVSDEDTPESRVALRQEAIAWAEGPGRELPRQDLVREIAAAARLEQFMETAPGAAGIEEEAGLPPEQAHYLAVLRNEAVSLSGRFAVASALADFAGPWLEPPLLAQAALVLDKAQGTRRPLADWQRLAITLTTGRAARHAVTDAAARTLLGKVPIASLDLKVESDRQLAKAWLLLCLKETEGDNFPKLMALLQEKTGDPEVLAMVLRSGQEARVANILKDADSKLYSMDKANGLESFDGPLAAAVEKVMSREEPLYARWQAALAVNSLPSAPGTPSRRERLEALAAKLPEVLEQCSPKKREQLLELLTVEPAAAIVLEKQYLAVAESSALSSLFKSTDEEVAGIPRQAKFWMTLLCAATARGDITRMTERLDAIRTMGEERYYVQSEAARHICKGIGAGWEGWDESTRKKVKEWLSDRIFKGHLTMLPGQFEGLEELPEPLREALGIRLE